MTKLFTYIKYVLLEALSGVRINKPYGINFAVTDNCNSKCVMCNVWVDKERNELSPQEIHDIFSNKSLSKVRHIGISGGEPTLRKDLVSCVSSILNAKPDLQSLSITSHGFNTSRWREFAADIAELCRRSCTNLTVNISVDGYGQLHDDVRRVTGGFDKVLKTIRILKSHNINIQLQCTISDKNAYGMSQLLEFAIENKIEIIYRIATEINRLRNTEIHDAFSLSINKASFVADFFRAERLHQQTRSLSRRMYYFSIADYLDGKSSERTFPCMFQSSGVFISSKGIISNCSVSDNSFGDVRSMTLDKLLFSSRSKELLQQTHTNKCRTCIHDQSGFWMPWDIAKFLILHGSLGKYVLTAKKTMSFLANTLNILLVSALWTSPHRPMKDKPALLIGAYGGEHVGDAAILGGVMLRLNKKYGLTKFVISSSRPNRTSRWLSCINLPNLSVSVDVIPSKLQNKSLEKYSCVVYAGGPMMELPLLMSKHLYTISLAKKNGLSIFIEGCGIGPIKTKLTKKIIFRILSLSSQISLRTKSSVDYAKDSFNISTQAVRDPAFDYLETLPKKNTHNPSGLIRVGLNLRPLWSKYNSSKLSEETVQAEYVLRLTKLMVMLNEKYKRQIEFVFFAMNADTLGMSDITMGYKLRKYLPKDITYSVVEDELCIDQLVELVDSFDLIIAMRFHACIFSMSRNYSNIIGLDYQIGMNGKVQELFIDNGMKDKCFNIEDISLDDMSRVAHEILESGGTFS